MITIVACLLLGTIAGWFLREQHARYVLKKIVQEVVSERAQDLADSLVPVLVEKRGDVFYLRNAKTEEFLAQGRTHEEITDVLKSRFPNIKFMADPKNLIEIGYPGTEDHDAV